MSTKHARIFVILSRYRKNLLSSKNWSAAQRPGRKLDWVSVLFGSSILRHMLQGTYHT